MVRKCLICKKPWNKMIDRSFHRFPKEYVRRATWMKHLYVTESDLLQSKNALVCSDHFALEDVYSNQSGQHFLKFNAVPKKLIIVEASSVNTLAVVESNDNIASPLLNESTDTDIKEEKNVFMDVAVKEEPYELYPINISSPIKRAVNVGSNVEPVFVECNAEIKKECNNCYEDSDRQLERLIKQKKRRKKIAGK